MRIIVKAILIAFLATVFAAVITQGEDQAPNELQAKIVSPLDNSSVPNEVKVSGTVEGTFPENKFLWLLAGKEVDNQWWPQGNSIITPIKGKWVKIALIGGGPTLNIGEEFQIVVILVDEPVNGMLKAWVEEGRINKTYPAINLPPGKVLDIITVIRSNG